MQAGTAIQDICRTAQQSKRHKLQQHSNPGQIQDSTATLNICRTAWKSRTDTRQYSNSGHLRDSTACITDTRQHIGSVHMQETVKQSITDKRQQGNQEHVQDSAGIRDRYMAGQQLRTYTGQSNPGQHYNLGHIQNSKEFQDGCRSAQEFNTSKEQRVIQDRYPTNKYNTYYSLPLRRVHEIKRMHLGPCTHGLFIT
jgi:hypothetical protein